MINLLKVYSYGKVILKKVFALNIRLAKKCSSLNKNGPMTIAFYFMRHLTQLKLEAGPYSIGHQCNVKMR